MNKITTIIIGLGNIGYLYDYNKSKNFVETHFRSISYNKRFVLKGVVENKLININKFKQNNDFPIFNNLKKIKKKIKDAKLFIVSTPEKTHFKIILDILKYYNPKVIFCEKPFCENYKKSIKILGIAKQKKVKIFVNYLRRIDKNISIIRNYLKKMDNKIDVYFSKNLKTNGSHFIDLFSNIFGKVHNIKIISKSNLKFVLYFKKATITFNLTKKNTKKTNYFVIKNKRYTINRTNNFYSITNNKTKQKIKLNHNKNLMLKNSSELINIFKYKKSKLATGDEAINTIKLINEIDA
tara:strand:- start:4124 stop:5008 length:885 start_codon:yes stop_codon:yes gene_type:complete